LTLRKSQGSKGFDLTNVPGGEVKAGTTHVGEISRFLPVTSCDDIEQVAYPTASLEREGLVTSPPEQITVKCPGCGRTYTDWWRPSINLTLDRFDEAYVEEATSATCPSCGLRISLEALIVRDDGVWSFSDADKGAPATDDS
jgi:ribosomal protein S27E